MKTTEKKRLVRDESECVVSIPLTQGQVALIDEVDGDLSQLKWCAKREKTKKIFPYYAIRKAPRTGGSRTSETLHRVIFARLLGRHLLIGEQVDHVNGNGLDNRRSNLRLASASQNGCNKGKNENNTSGYKGVTFCRSDRKWRAQIRSYGDAQPRYLGGFSSIIDAAIAYDRAAYELHGEFARANFPRFASGLEDEENPYLAKPVEDPIIGMIRAEFEKAMWQQKVRP